MAQNWKRDRAGKYARFRRVNGTLYVDVVALVGRNWRFSTGAKGEDKIGDGTDYSTRTKATSALDRYIERPNQEQMEIPNTEVRHKCDGCPGDGIYRGHGYVENGVFKGVTGKCFRCDGKGYQTDADVRRCSNYDNHIRKVKYLA